MTAELLIEPGPIIRLTINRREYHNAIDTTVGDEMVETVRHIGRERYGDIGVIKESITRFVFPARGDDLRMQLIGHCMADLYRQQPVVDTET